jgi:DNA-binding response OmpR family regulator
MSVAATVVFARADLSIPGAAEPADAEKADPSAVEARFFDLIDRSSPDVIVLDFSRGPIAGAETILAVRRETEVPVLVVCSPEQPKMEEYRIAGAADCIAAPVDIITLNHAIQRLMRARGRGRLPPRRASERASAGVQHQRA